MAPEAGRGGMSDQAATRVRMAAIFLLSASGLLLQVSMTRVLSLIAWHHFAYLIISLALLGIGAAGTYLTLSPKLREGQVLDPWIARWAWLFSLATMVCLVGITRIRFAPIAIYQEGDWSQLYSLALVELGIVVPYFFAGVAMGAILSTAGRRIGGVYFADLVGAALGAVLALFLINGLGGIAAIFGSAVLSACAAWVLGRGSGRPARAYGATAAAALVLTALSSVTDLVPITFPPSKLAFRKEKHIETTRWNAIARIDVFQKVRGFTALAAGLSEQAPNEPFVFQQIAQDGAAPTAIVHLTTGPEDLGILGYYLQAIPYVGYERPRVLVIGAGGGVDLLLALHHGAEHVVGAEVNPAMVRLLRRDYLAQSGYLAVRPDVELRLAEGRHFVSSRRSRRERTRWRRTSSTPWRRCTTFSITWSRAGWCRWRGGCSILPGRHCGWSRRSSVRWRSAESTIPRPAS
jgi:hypothetical protein